jgi:hypothetical protein
VTTEIKAMTKTIEKLVDRVTDLESKMSDLRHNDLESVTEMEQVTTVHSSEYHYSVNLLCPRVIKCSWFLLPYFSTKFEQVAAPPFMNLFIVAAFGEGVINHTI